MDHEPIKPPISFNRATISIKLFLNRSCQVFQCLLSGAETPGFSVTKASAIIKNATNLLKSSTTAKTSSSKAGSGTKTSPNSPVKTGVAKKPAAEKAKENKKAPSKKKKGKKKQKKKIRNIRKIIKKAKKTIKKAKKAIKKARKSQLLFSIHSTDAKRGPLIPSNPQCPLWIRSGLYCGMSIMSAFGGKADMKAIPNPLVLCTRMNLVPTPRNKSQDTSEN